MADQTGRMPVRIGKLRRRAAARAQAQPIEHLRAEIDRLLSDFLRGYWHVPFRHAAVDVEPILRSEVSLAPRLAVDIIDRDDS